MGLFSSSYKYYAFAGSSNLFEEEDYPETVKSNIVQAVTSNAFSITDGIRFGLGTDMYQRAKSMFRYATKEGGYIWGVPETGTAYIGISTEMLKPYIEADAGGPIDFRSLYWGTFTEQEPFFVEKEINENYLDTNYFNWPIGNPTDTNWSPVDDSVEIPIEDPGTPGTYFLSDNQFDFTIAGANYQVTFPYSGGTYSVDQPFDLSQYQAAGDWICVRYRMQGGGDQYLYWTYRIGSGENPALEDEIESENLEMNYLPIAILMHDTVWFDDSGNQEWEDTLDRLLRDLTLDPYDIKEDYLEQQAEDDASGDVDRSNVEDTDFFVHFNIPIKTHNRGGREYLFYFFDFLRTRTTWTTFDGYQAWLAAGAGGEQPISKLNVEEGEPYTGYIARYGWSYITKVTVAGEFTPPDWPEPLQPRRMWSDTIEFGSPEYNYGLDLVHGAGNYIVAASQPDEQEHSYTIITRMNTDNTHTHILMMGPGMEYQINTSLVPVGVGDGGYVDYRYRFVDCELFPEDPERDSEFRWPVFVQSLQEVSVLMREQALADGLCATVFMTQEVKVKWYQKGFFKWLIIIIAVILIVLSIIFPGFIAAAAFLLASALGGGLLAFYIIYVILMFAVGFIISMAGNLIGGTAGTIFAVVGMIIVGARAGMSGAGGGGMANLSSQSAWGSAISLINTTVPYLQGGLQIYQSFALEKLERDMEDFLKTAREKYDELKDAWDMIGGMGGNIEPLSLSAQFDRWYVESADNFFRRTLNANPGVLGYDLINNFAGIALTLPENGNDTNIIEDMFLQLEYQRGAA